MKLGHILNTKFRLVTSIALTIGFFSFLADVLGVLRNRIFAGEFGAGNVTDMYFAAFLVPDFIYNLFIVGMLSSVFIPIFSEYWERSQEEAWHFANVVLTVFVAAMIMLSLVAILCAPQLVSLIAPGFDQEKQAGVVTLMRIMFASPILLGVSNIVGSILQVNRMFFSYALAPVLYNTGIIIGAVFFVKPFGPAGLALGVVFGAFLHFLIQLPPLLRIGFRFVPAFEAAHKGLKHIAWLSLPRAVGLAAYQINFVVITAIASTVATGSVAIFNFANDLQYVPIGIVALSFASAVFPFLAQSYAKGNIKEFLDRFYSTVNQILFLVIPISVFLIFERAQVVRVILGYGQFSWDHTRLTAAVLGAFTLSIFAQSLTPLFSRAFYALKDTKTPVAINIFSVGVNIALSFYFLHLMRLGGSFSMTIVSLFRIQGVAGAEILALPLAFSVAAVINLLLLYFAFSQRVDEFDGSLIVLSLFKINFSALVMAPCVYATLNLVAQLVNMGTFLGVLFQGLAAFAVGFIVYAALAYALKMPEFFSLLEAMPASARRFLPSAPYIPVNSSERI